MSTSNSTIYLDPNAECLLGYTPDQNGWLPPEACNANYLYYPSFVAACIFTVLFTISLAAQVFQAITYKKIRLCSVVLMCAAWELVGFALRSASTRYQQSTLLFYPSSLFIMLAPIWLNAFVYMVLGRMIYFFLPERTICGIRAQRIALCFVSGDIISFVIQACGGALLASKTYLSTQKIGLQIYIDGIAVQQFIILVFTAFALRFRYRMLSIESKQQQQQQDPVSHLRSWRVLLYALFVALALISVRIVFRLLEFAYGFDPNNYLAYHEWAFYVFDASAMLVAVVVVTVVHPGRVLVGPDSEFPRIFWRKKRDTQVADHSELIRMAQEGKETEGRVGDGNLFLVEMSDVPPNQTI